MLLKLETFIEVETKEPQAVKQTLNALLSRSIRRLQENAKLFSGYYGEKSLITAGNHLQDFWNPTFVERNSLRDIREFAYFLNFLKVQVPTEEQVLERIRKGLENKRS